jgi:maleate cis-trans isomerase
MKAASRYNPYGWRARVGLVVPSINKVAEPEFWRLAPPGVAFHVARAANRGATTEESYFKMADAALDAAEDLATADVDMVLYACTSGSVVCPLPKLLSDMQQRSGLPTIATINSVVAALRTLGAQRVALATPYVDFVNQTEKQFLEDYGFHVTSVHGLQMGETQEERRGIGRVPPQHVYRMARLVDRPDADAIFISCTNLATLDVIAQIEADLGKPVVTSNQASFWSCLRLMGLPDRIEGYGKLLAAHTAPMDLRTITQGLLPDEATAAE